LAGDSRITLKPSLTIGIDDGDEALMFGRIVRIDVDGRGNIYVLDYKYRKVGIFDRDGRPLRTIAIPEGQGPREATNLSGIAVTPGGTLFINDMRKVIVYGPDGDYLRTFLVGFMISSIGCAGTEELLAIGPNEGRILHAFDSQGRLLASFGETFTPPGELAEMKDMPMFGAPFLFDCAKDGRIYVMNPHEYTISVFKGRRPESVIKGHNEAFVPVKKMGRGFVSTAARIISSGDLLLVALQGQGPESGKTADVFRAGRQIGTVELPGTPHVADPQSMIYFAEQAEGGLPRVVRYEIVKN
jgi:hypothetical protein